ncbi:MAG: glycosyltransferase family 2 protein [Anaerolineae bacterium]
MKPVAAVVPTWNARPRLDRVLDGLGRQVDLVVAVDNGSTDGTAEALAAWAGGAPGRVAVPLATNQGYPAAVNAGARVALGAGAAAFALANDDAVFDAGAVVKLCRGLEADPRAAATTAKLVYEAAPGTLNGTGGLWVPRRAWASLRGEGEVDGGQYDQDVVVSYPSGAGSLIRAAAWRDVGPMDEAYFLYYEDADWGLRAAEKGWRVLFVPAATVRHMGSAGTAEDPARRRYYNVRNRLLFASRHAPPRGRGWAWAATGCLMAKQPARWLDPGRRRDAEAVFRAVADHLRQRYGRGAQFG